MALEVTPGFLQNLNYNAEIFRRGAYGFQLQRGSTVGSAVGGVVGAGDFTTTYGGSGLGVTTSTGEAIVAGSSSTVQSGYYVRGSSATTNTPASANPSNPRVDLLYIQLNDATYTGSTNSATLSIATGTATSGASLANLTGAPSLPTSSLALAYVLVPAAATSISNSDIANVAGPVKSGLPTSARLVTQAYGAIGGGVTNQTYFLTDDSVSPFVVNGGSIVSSGAGSIGVLGLFNFIAADWTLGSFAPELTLKITTICNATSPGQTFTAGIGSSLSYAGATGTLSLTAGGNVGQVAVTPSASSAVSGEVAVAFPANGEYVLFVNVGGTTAAASVVYVVVQLWANA